MAFGMKVLCVDDNQDAAETAAHLLKMAGCEVRVCYDGATALAVAREFGPAVCVIDLTMPGMDGEELAVRLREGSGAPRCIALTGAWSPDSFHRTKASGFEVHLVKPVDPKQFVDVVTGKAPAAR